MVIWKRYSLAMAGQVVMIKPRSKTLIRWLQLIIVLSLLALLWRVADGDQALSLLINAEPIYLALSFLALTGQTLLSSQRWRITARRIGFTLRPIAALREYYLSQVANQSLPGGVLGDATRVLRTGAKPGWFASALAVLIERMAGQISLFMLFLISLGVNLIFPSEFALPIWVGVFAMISVGLVASAFLLILGFAKKGRSSIAAKMAEFLEVSKDALLGSGVWVSQFLLSLGIVILNIMAFVFATRAIGFDLNLLIAFVIVPLVLLSMLIPVSIGGWGVREAFSVALFPIMGATVAQGFAASVAFGLVFLASSLPGLLLFLIRDKSSAESAEVGNG